MIFVSGIVHEDTIITSFIAFHLDSGIYFLCVNQNAGSSTSYCPCLPFLIFSSCSVPGIPLLWVHPLKILVRCFYIFYCDNEALEGLLQSRLSSYRLAASASKTTQRHSVLFPALRLKDAALNRRSRDFKGTLSLPCCWYFTCGLVVTQNTQFSLCLIYQVLTTNLIE